MNTTDFDNIMNTLTVVRDGNIALFDIAKKYQSSSEESKALVNFWYLTLENLLALEGKLINLKERE